MRRLLPIILFAAAVAGPALAAPQTAPSSQLVKLNEDRCVEVSPETEEVGDSLFKRCIGPANTPIWVLYLDGTRLRLGFGRAANFSGMFDADRDPAWPLEWRGRGVGRAFKPYAVIVRLRAPGERPSHLVVFKLTPDGASCIVGNVAPGPNQNLDARRLADANAPCEAPADRPQD